MSSFATNAPTGGREKAMRSHPISPNACLNCGKRLDAADAFSTNAKPRKGDLMVCAYCSHVMEWTGKRLAELSDEAIKEMAGDPEMLQTIEFTSAYQQWAKDNPR
jgi:DNA-directed RNA polymerase subunit RPC12/RpoP